MINHRGPEFAAMLARILDGMKPYFGTTDDIAMLTTAGSGGLEAGSRQHALARRPGPRRLDRLLRRPFAKIAGTYGADVTKIDAEWGQAAIR